MKQLFIIALLFISCAAYSQTPARMRHTTFNPKGIVQNTGKDTMYYDLLLPVTTGLGFHVAVTRDSGTVAGTAVLYRSNTPNGPWASMGDTLTLANAALQSFYIEKRDPIAYHYMIITTGSGTMAAKVDAQVTERYIYIK